MNISDEGSHNFNDIIEGGSGQHNLDILGMVDVLLQDKDSGS